ncbi:MAG: LLM class flavin-dependent oxidoreductase [Ilumatobacteraceae bacterium]
MDWSVNLMAKAPIGEIVELAVLAEQLGYERCWLFDEGMMTRDVFVTLTAIAEHTSTIKIGPGITNPYTRHPGTTAAAIASLDEMSGGRAFVGIGAGGGLALGPLAVDRIQPLKVVADAVFAMRKLFAGEAVTMVSETFALSNARLGYSRPDIEIIMAGRGPRMTELGGRIADGFYLSYPYLPGLGDQSRAIRDAANGADRHIAWSTGIARDEHEVQQMRAQLTFRLVDSPEAVREALGLGPNDREAIRSALVAGGPPAAAHLVREEWLGSFGVVGTTSECRDQIRAIASNYGVSEFIVPVQDLGSAEDLITSFAPVAI